MKPTLIIKRQGIMIDEADVDAGNGKFLKCLDGKIVAATVNAALDIGDAVGTGTPNSILFIGSTGNLAQDNANFFWDDSTNRLGIGTTNPNAQLEISSNSPSLRFIDTDVSHGITTLVPTNVIGSINFGSKCWIFISRDSWRNSYN